MSRAQSYLIAYDIANPRRLLRVGRAMTKHAIRVQYSVFLGEFTRLQLLAVVDELHALIDRRVDDVRIYALPREPTFIWIGQSLWPSGVRLAGTGLPIAR